VSRAGIGLLVTARVTAIVGGVLIATSNTGVKLQRTGVGKPRYWIGEF
jgi:hypothetical protein